MEVTRLFWAYGDGDGSALEKLRELLYPELKTMARRRAASGPGMGATTLVHETFAQLFSGGRLSSDDGKQFFGLIATIMRRISLFFIFSAENSV